VVVSCASTVRARDPRLRCARAFDRFGGCGVEVINKQLGDKVVVQETGMSFSWGIAVNPLR